MDLTMDMGDPRGVFPFVEDENANITGAGHQDKATFAAEVNRYDQFCTGDEVDPDDLWDDCCIGWVWAVVAENEETLSMVVDGQPVTESTPGAVPLTTLWGQR